MSSIIANNYSSVSSIDNVVHSDTESIMRASVVAFTPKNPKYHERRSYPLSAIRSTNMDRRSRRILTYIKLKALKVLGPKKLEVPISSPKELKPIPTIAKPENPLLAVQRSMARAFAMTECSTVGPSPQVLLFVPKKEELKTLSPAFEQRALDMFKFIAETKRYSSVTVKNENGIYMPFGDMGSLKSYCELHKYYEPTLGFSSELLGGNPRNKKKGRRMKRRKGGRRKQGMIQAGQLGMRNPRQMKVNYPVVKEFWRYNQVLETDASGNLSAYVSLRNPLKAINGSGVYLRAQDLAVVYDEFKVLRTALIVDFLFINPQVGDIAIATDYDSVPAGPYSYSSLVDTQYSRVFNGTNQISFSSKVPRLSEGTYQERPCIIHQGGFYDFNTPPDEGFIALAFERYTPNTRLVRVTTMMEVLCRRRRTLNASEEPDIPISSKINKTVR